MDLATIEQNVGELDVTQGFDLIFDLLAAYGMPKASITRLRKGSANRSDRDDEVLWKGKVYYRDLSGDPSAPDPHVVIDDAAGDERIAKQQPRFLIVRTASQLLAVDTKTSDSLDIPLEKLALNAAFFMPWAGVEKTQLEAAHYADIKAAEKMAQLYDEIRKVNDVESDEEIHALNVFFTRLLFCFFAEDTGIFEDGQVTKAIGSLTHQDGSDLHHFLGKLFETLDTPVSERGDLPSYLAAFGYVNGSLFAQRTGIPVFSAKARAIILECAELDWSEISPDIFGSMMQAVVSPAHRAGHGMHYTSVANILRVLRPLFLNELEADLAAAGDEPRALARLHDRLARIRVLDPACGSGNFLVVAYRELRRLEIEVMGRLSALASTSLGGRFFEVSRIDLRSFSGIEVDDFAHEVARLSLWLAKHQMNALFRDRFGAFPPLIPLEDAGRIVCANAVRVPWSSVVDVEGPGEVFVCGNPPYLGSSMQDASQKADFVHVFGTERYPRNLDYVSLWFLLGAEFARATGSRVGFVSTNSISQGDHVGLLWPDVLARGVEIAFATTPFRWANNAKGGAGVTCVVVGLARPPVANKQIFDDSHVTNVAHISPYLIPAADDQVVTRARRPLSDLPPMVFGSKPTDGGNLILSPSDREALLDEYPPAERWVRRYMGAEEFLNGKVRYCLWVPDGDAAEAVEVPSLAKRFEAVAAMRAGGSSPARAMADRPHRFLQRAHRDTGAVIVPGVSSEHRVLVPIGFVGPEVVISNLAMAVYDAEPWLFAILQSQMHMAWLRTVGGALETRLRYSSDLVYNTFPMPKLDDAAVLHLTHLAMDVLAIREAFPTVTLGDLYTPDGMPDALRVAHDRNDAFVDALYGTPTDGSQGERAALLLSMYGDAVRAGGG